MIYLHPAFNVNCRPTKIYWWINRIQKLHQNILLLNWNYFINTIMPSFFIQATDITAHPNINGNFISFLWIETGCKLGSNDKFENDKLYSSAITQQNDFGFFAKMWFLLQECLFFFTFTPWKRIFTDVLNHKCP